jgi:hypothetical protein
VFRARIARRAPLCAPTARTYHRRVTTSEPSADEARRIAALVGDDHRAAYDLIERQLAVLVMRTQVLLSLSGIVITVTGFSGRAIAQTSVAARASIVVGILVVLAAALTAIGGVLRLRWLSQILGEDVHATVARGLALRDQKSRWLATSMTLFGIGFAAYCIAIAQLLLDPH